METTLQLALDPPFARLRLTGELDLSVHDQLRDLFGCLAGCGCVHVELDLLEVGYVDVGSLRLLDEEKRRLEGAGGRFEVVAASETYLMVSDLAGYLELQPSPFDPPPPRLLGATVGPDAVRMLELG